MSIILLWHSPPFTTWPWSTLPALILSFCFLETHPQGNSLLLFIGIWHTRETLWQILFDYILELFMFGSQHFLPLDHIHLHTFSIITVQQWFPVYRVQWSHPGSLEAIQACSPFPEINWSGAQDLKRSLVNLTCHPDREPVASREGCWAPCFARDVA